MDALAVSAVSGMTQQPRLRQALLLAAAFGGFQGLMPLLGYYAGNWLAVAACLWAPWAGCWWLWVAKCCWIVCTAKRKPSFS